MDFGALLNLILGQGGAIVILCVVVIYLQRDNSKLRTSLDASQDERLKDLKEAAMVASAYVQLREQDKASGAG